jgi:hypothetical protein
VVCNQRTHGRFAGAHKAGQDDAPRRCDRTR